MAKDLAPSQRTAVQQALASRVLIITGGPGMVLRNLIDSAVVPVVRLTEVFRQAAHI